MNEAMPNQKEVHFNHEGQDYFITLPTPMQGPPTAPFNQLMALLESQGIREAYHVEEDVKGRYLTILVDKTLRLIEESAPLPAWVELRAGKDGEPYLYLAESLTIIAHDPAWLAIVDRVWNGWRPKNSRI